MQRRGNSDRHWGTSRRQNTQHFVETPRRDLPPALGNPIITLNQDSLDAKLRSGLPEIDGQQYLASYNLMEGLSKTILVPGRPALWTSSSTAIKLSPDSGNYYRDENAARFEDHPFDPAVHSILRMNPQFDPSAVDIVACGSTLGNLFRFVRGKVDPFSFTIHVIGETAFFVRRENSARQLIEGIHGFGHSFVEANTTWSHDVRRSSSHQRIISYFLGGRKIIVRFEVDSYSMDQSDELDSDDENDGVSVSVTSLEDDLAALIRPKASESAEGSIEVVEKGRPVALKSAIDIKTRSFRKNRNDVITEQLPRLWLRQVENIVLAFHNNGLFQPAVVEDISGLLAEWETQNEADVVRFINLLGLLREKTEIAEHAKLEVRCDGGKTLYLHELSAVEGSKWSAISEELCTRWAQKHSVGKA